MAGEGGAGSSGASFGGGGLANGEGPGSLFAGGESSWAGDHGASGSNSAIASSFNDDDADAGTSSSLNLDAAASAPVTLAKEALSLFKSKKFSESLAVLEEIRKKKDDDPKVLHNIAVVEYYQGGCTEPKLLLEALERVKGKSEELARTAEQQLEGLSAPSSSGPSTALTLSLGSTSPPASPRGSTSQAVAAESIDSASGSASKEPPWGTAYMEEYDTSLPTLNKAIILYHMQQYAAAAAELEPLYRNIEPIDEAAALRVCLLLLDIFLAARLPDKAVGVLDYVEKAFGYLLTSGESADASLHTQQPQALLPAAAGASNSNILDGAELSLDAVEALEGESYTGVGVINRTTASAPLPSASPWPASVDKSVLAISADFKLWLHLHKARLQLLTRNTKGTKKEVKSALSVSRENSQALFLKAHLEYSRRNFRKAMKLHTAFTGSTDMSLAPLFYNNMGCIHHHLGKHATAAIYFSRAFNAATANLKQPLTVPAFSKDKRLHIAYHAGIQQLLLGNYTAALALFQQATALYHTRPYLWLRLAECCVQAYATGQAARFSHETGTHRKPTSKSVIAGSLGTGKLRQLVLPTGRTASAVASDEPPSGVSNGFDSKRGELSLDYAAICLRNAAHLINRLDATSASAVDKPSVTLAATLRADALSKQLPASAEVRRSISGGSTASNAETAVLRPAMLDGSKEASSTSIGSTSSMSSMLASFAEERKRQLQQLKHVVLAYQAYVALSQGDMVSALAACQALLSSSNCSRSNLFLARNYAAEALCMLDRVKEAAEHLSLAMADQAAVDKAAAGKRLASTTGLELDSVTINASDEPLDLSSPSLRATLYTNMAAACAMQEDLQQAFQYAMHAFTLAPTSSNLLALVYVELRRGHTESALSLLKKQRPIPSPQPVPASTPVLHAPPPWNSVLPAAQLAVR
eukprot:jgi/Chlat1/560/Chrsp103S01128